MKRIKPVAGILIALILGALTIGIGQIVVRDMDKGFGNLESGQMTNIINGYIEQLCANDFESFYENTAPLYDSKTAYEAKLKEVFTDIDPDDVIISNTDNVYKLYYNDQLLCNMTIEETEDGYKASIPVKGYNAYTFEVPSDMNLVINNQTIEPQETMLASNYNQLYDEADGVNIRTYEINDVLDIPDLTNEKDEPLTALLDPMSTHYLVGKEVTDEAILDLILDGAEALALYPAEDASLSSVSQYNYSNSSWYSRYSSLQNAWFTSHATYNISNEEVTAIYQDDDHIVSHITFDYFADNGEVSRTWYIGYQLTFINTSDGWKICGTEIDNELNPRQIEIE